MTLVEWIDAIRAYSDVHDLKFEAMEQYQLSLFELERATGIALLHPEIARDEDPNHEAR